MYTHTSRRFTTLRSRLNQCCGQRDTWHYVIAQAVTHLHSIGMFWTRYLNPVCLMNSEQLCIQVHACQSTPITQPYASGMRMRHIDYPTHALVIHVFCNPYLTKCRTTQKHSKERNTEAKGANNTSTQPMTIGSSTTLLCFKSACLGSSSKD